MAEEVGVNVVSMTRYESNDREPNIETLSKIATALGKSINDLVNSERIMAEEIIDKLILMDDLTLNQKATKIEIPIDELMNWWIE